VEFFVSGGMWVLDLGGLFEVLVWLVDELLGLYFML